MNKLITELKIIETYAKKTDKNFQDYATIINNLNKAYAHEEELTELIKKTNNQIIGIGTLTEKRELEKSPWIKVIRNVSYLTNEDINIEKTTNGFQTTHNASFEATIKFLEKYEYKVHGKLGFLGIGKNASYERINKNQEIKFTQKQQKQQEQTRIYTQPNTKIYLLTQQELQNINQLLN